MYVRRRLFLVRTKAFHMPGQTLAAPRVQVICRWLYTLCLWQLVAPDHRLELVPSTFGTSLAPHQAHGRF